MTLHDNHNRRRDREGGMGWGIPAAIFAILLIVGGLIYMNADTRTTTASTTTPTTTTSTTGPAGSQAPVRPPTTTPAPAPKQ